MSAIRERILRGRTQLGSWIMRPPLERAETHVSLMPPAGAEPDPTDDPSDAA